MIDSYSILAPLLHLLLTMIENDTNCRCICAYFLNFNCSTMTDHLVIILTHFVYILLPHLEHSKVFTFLNNVIKTGPDQLVQPVELGTGPTFGPHSLIKHYGKKPTLKPVKNLASKSATVYSTSRLFSRAF
jgi:hypothetical protein